MIDHVSEQNNMRMRQAQEIAVKYENKIKSIEASSMHGQLPIVWDKAEDIFVYDPLGNKYIDFSSGIFIANAGHNNKAVKQAILEAMDGPMCTYTYLSNARVDYLEYLIANTPDNFEKAFLLSAGTEATEAAFKLIKLYGQNKGYEKNIILCFEGNWHGRTMGAQMLSSNVDQRAWIDIDSTSSILHLPFPFEWEHDYKSNNGYEMFYKDLNELATKYQFDPYKDIRGIFMETFQGWGALFYPQPYIEAIRTFLENADALLCFDEMQAGFGRTGKLFGYQHYNIEPDLICCGKGISSSLPLSAVLGRAELLDLPGSGNMSSTHSASPLCCAASHASFRYINDHNLIESSQKMGDLFIGKLKHMQDIYPNISHVSGKGLISALHFGKHPLDNEGKHIANAVVADCLLNGLITVRTGRESIKFGPPLTIDKEHLLKAVNILENAIKKNA